MALPVLRRPRRWSGETQAIRKPLTLPDFDFRTFSRIPKNGFVSRAECFIATFRTKPTLLNR
jgi:hypothetical protein